MSNNEEKKESAPSVAEHTHEHKAVSHKKTEHSAKEGKHASKATSHKHGGGIAGIIGSEHKKAKRIKISKQDLKKDELVEASTKIVDYLTSHGNTVLITTGTVIVVFLLAVLINFYKSSQRDKANAIFTKARNLFDLGLNETPPSVTTLKNSLEEFNTLTENFKGKVEASLAYLYKGNIYYNLQDFDNAIESYNKFLSFGLDNKTFETLAKKNIAYCYESKKEYDKAIQLFKDLSDNSEGYVKESTLIELGLVYEMAEKYSDAVKVYQDFIANYKDSSLINKAQERVNSIQAK